MFQFLICHISDKVFAKLAEFCQVCQLWPLSCQPRKAPWAASSRRLRRRRPRRRGRDRRGRGRARGRRLRCGPVGTQLAVRYKAS